MSTTLTALIVDDEELARRGIRSRLQRADDVEILDECENGRSAVRAIRELSPDLVFLDVQMPGLDGFDVIDEIGAAQMPTVIFVTAYDQHALRAFDVHALDYLLKPMDEQRFQQALARARKRHADQNSSALGQRLAALLADLDDDALASGAPSSASGSPGSPAAPDSNGSPGASSAPTERFPVKSGGRIRFVDTDDIIWVEAAGDYVRLHTAEKSHLLRETMSGMVDQLDDSRFLRIHRSTIINTDCLAELRPYGNNEYIAVLDDGTECKLSRTYREDLTEFFDGAV